MPSSLIIVGLAAAWLAVLVPMVARKRQVITQTNDAALAARVVRSGDARRDTVPGASRGEFAGGGRAQRGADVIGDEDLVDDGFDEHDGRDERGGYDGSADVSDHDTHGDDVDAYGDEPGDGRGEDGWDEDDWDEDGAVDPDATGDSGEAVVTEQGPARRYRPGRGGFDPEAAALAARAKYAFRQRVVIALLLTVVVTAVAAGVVLPVLWWAHGAADVVLVGYLAYLRRQVRIEEEIRQRRLARLRAATRRAPRRPDPLTDIEVLKTERRDAVGCERKPMPTSRVRRQAVVVDLEDEDPAFHELDDPGRLTYRRAAGE